MEGNRIFTNDYKKELIIGSGTFGTVYLIKQNRACFALKEINMNSLSSVEKQRAFNEVSLLAKLKHRNIVEYITSTFDHTTGNLLIVMEYADCGDLSSAIKKQKGHPFPERKTISWFVQICLALQYIHSQNILHRDLKTPNIFLCKENTIKVGDFGIARILRETEDFACTSIGTPYYLSPEICLRKPYNCKSDMWALGCILFEISALTRPFTAESFPHLMGLILEGKRAPFPNWSSDLVRQLVQDLLSFDPNHRPTTDELLAYPPLQPYQSDYFKQSPKGILPRTKLFFGGPATSLKRSASSASTLNCNKQRKFSPKSAENEQKSRPVFPRTFPPAVNITEYKTLSKFQENERKPRSASTRSTPPVTAVTEHKNSEKIPSSKTVLKNRGMYITYTVDQKTDSNKENARFACPRNIPPAIVVTEYKTPDKFQENESRPRSASTRVSPAIAVPEYSAKFRENERKPRSASARATPPATVITEYKNPEKVLIENRCNMNVTYNVEKTNSDKNSNSNVTPSASPTDIDYGYSSEEINCSADSIDNNTCEHSINNSENNFSILKDVENEEKLSDQSLCLHSQCHQCMIDMMWKNRIRGCVGVYGNDSDYLKLKKKLMVIFKHDLFQKIYESLSSEWEGNETNQSKASIRSYVKFLNYEQVQHLPLMMQLIQLDLVKLKQEDKVTSNELVML